MDHEGCKLIVVTTGEFNLHCSNIIAIVSRVGPLAAIDNPTNAAAGKKGKGVVLITPRQIFNILKVDR